METKVISVLVIEDNPGDQLIINEYLHESGEENYSIKNCSSLAEGIEHLKKEKTDAVILDLGLPDSKGLESLKIIKEVDDSIPIIVLTIYKSDETGIEAIKFGAQDYFVKDELREVNLDKSIKYSISRKKLELELRTALDMYENTFEQAAHGIAHLSLDTAFIKVNQKFCDILGYSKKEMAEKSIADVTHPDDLEKDLVEMKKIISGSIKNYSLEKRFIHKDGSVIWANLTRSPVLSKNEIHYLFTTIEDITERKTLEFELQKQRNLLDKIINILPVGMFITDGKGNLLRNNLRCEKIWAGMQYESLDSLEKYKGWFAYNGKKLEVEDWGIYKAINNKEATIGDIINIKSFDGTNKTIINSAVPLIEDGEVISAVVVNEDITKLIQVENKLKASLKEKELLIKESHHRIKNNLQLILSLLNFPLAKINDQKVKNILTDSMNRIMSISTMHEFLYKAAELDEVNVQTYINRIVDHISATMLGKVSHIKIIKEIENFNINSGLAISLGLIINELITNAVKHAFENRNEGIINLDLKQIGPEIILIVRDNGIGISKDIKPENVETFGFQIINSLVEQYNGTITINVDNGTEFLIKMPVD